MGSGVALALGLGVLVTAVSALAVAAGKCGAGDPPHPVRTAPAPRERYATKRSNPSLMPEETIADDGSDGCHNPIGGVTVRCDASTCCGNVAGR